MSTLPNCGICAFCKRPLPGIMSGSHGCCDDCLRSLTADFLARNPRGTSVDVTRAIQRKIIRIVQHLHGDEVWAYDGLCLIALRFTAVNTRMVIKWLTPDNVSAAAIKQGLDFEDETPTGYVQVVFAVREIHRFRRWLLSLVWIEYYQRFEVIRVR